MDRKSEAERVWEAIWAACPSSVMRQQVRAVILDRAGICEAAKAARLPDNKDGRQIMRDAVIASLEAAKKFHC